MIQLEFEQMLMDEKRFIDTLIRASIFDIGKHEETSKFIEDDVFKSEYDIKKVYDNGMSFFLIVAMTNASLRIQIGHVCDKKLDKVIVSNNNTKLFGHMYQNNSTYWFYWEVSY